MKILSPGREGQKSWTTEATCTGHGNGLGGCGARLLVEKTDLYKTHQYDYGGGHDVFTTFMCPQCEVETDIDVPSNIGASLPDKKERKTK